MKEVTSCAAVVKYGENEEDVVYAGKHNEQMVEGIRCLHLNQKSWKKTKTETKTKTKSMQARTMSTEQLVEGICHLNQKRLGEKTKPLHSASKHDN